MQTSTSARQIRVIIVETLSILPAEEEGKTLREAVDAKRAKNIRERKLVHEEILYVEGEDLSPAEADALRMQQLEGELGWMFARRSA